MIFYATSLTYNRLHIRPSELLHHATEEIYPQYDYMSKVKKQEKWSEIYEWYIELFYFGGRKCLRTVHLSSMFTLFFADVDESFMHSLGYIIRNELYKYFYGNNDTVCCLHMLNSDSFLNFYSRISDKSRMSRYRLDESRFDCKNTFFSRFIIDGRLDTTALNKAVNTEYEFVCPENRGATFHSADKLTHILSSVYGSKIPDKHSINLRYKIELSPHESKIYGNTGS